MRDGSAVETASAGWEGMVGLPAFLGVESAPAQAVCQKAAKRSDSTRAPCSAKSRRSGELRTILNRYTQAYFRQVAQAGL
jgi:hypothetical protein